ncbi:polysaccharide pyruvyl transferase family protein [Flammeovirga sp. MY04]|uniref:polysaccharide pyruvyl transferase family protein n=1 Tax=Flammeovirga sp. MY04 TaxID=1191459 RepID=UPI000A04C700|nr:polysaccharide pyruvyl transferase family protein [Flammeovirga sp. MY04]ANQ47874.2 polysaccharide pyruvyl transferase family protein [Flammeovirga sp. MY04]
MNIQKMNYKLLAVSKFTGNSGVNIGDYVQALAGSQFIPQIDGFIDRDEELKDYDGDPCKMIMNGWYMHSPEKWPPSKLIDPLLISFHLNSVVKEEMLSPVSIDFFKSHQPIGCRDFNTMEMLNSKGVEAYFSGCLTLTLGEKYRSSKRGNKSYIVDPHINVEMSWDNKIKAISTIIQNPLDILTLYRNKQLSLHNGRNLILRALKTALYFKEYSRIFSRKVVMESIYVNQENDFYKTHFKTDLDRLNEAERLVKQYAEASLVITSRIHCALPSLGMETPVIYLEKGQDTEESKCRLDGIKSLFNVVKVDKGVLVPQFETTLPITASNIPPNKNTWRELAKNLKHSCQEFVSNYKS